MQDKILLALRKRLSKRGYTNIHIYKATGTIEEEIYRISAVEPLAKKEVETEVSIIQANYLMR